MGIGHIAFHPLEQDHLFATTGDRDALGTRSIGLIESYDGGDTWDTTGLSYNLYDFKRIYRVLIHPTQPDTMYVATLEGIFRSYDAAATWTQVYTGYVLDLEFKPDDPSTIMGVFKDMLRSTDNGDNFTVITSGLPNTSLIIKAQIAVTPADPDVVYYHCANTSPSTFHGIYRSNDGGLNFTVGATSPNMYGYDQNGADNSGQTGYNMAITVNDTNANDVIIAGIRPWRSLDGGQSFSIMTDYTNAYVHSDIHWMAMYGTDIYACSDGGISKTSNDGTTWNYMNNGLTLTQYNRLGISATKEYLMVGGAQDNGTSKLNNTEWKFIRGADGGQCRISRQDTNYIWASTQWGSIAKSYNGGVTFANVINPQVGAFLAPLHMHPTNDDTLYIGRVDVWRTYDAGANWNQISSFSTDYMEAMDVSDLNTDYIYVANDDQTYMTADGGSNWTDISAGLPADNPSDIEISENDSMKVWLTIEGYTAGTKVYYSSDGGANWSNISDNLPNTPINCIVHEKDSPDRVYVGTDMGVFVRDNNMGQWQPFNEGMPALPVNDMDIFYPNTKLRAATYGRGMWESDLYTAPVVGITEKEAIEMDWAIYPNPTTGLVTITGVKGATYKITDLQGRSIAKGKVNTKANLSEQAEGVYLITVAGQTQKLVLTRD
ncbi:MAG TPA: T9SS type A sorting domain-containing protein [Flavobacteriales bacterium]|nr:T9SS type A sorting domain-containing protein [Flavobacteriales bacterium]